tara:strand:+ start:134 stop:406 length:273 start_codon:yes stop_codon:yes gene_type:complete
MGNCFLKKKIKPITHTEIIQRRNYNNENNLKEVNDYVESKFQKIDKIIIEEYGEENIKLALKTQWWTIKTDIPSFDNVLREINKKIFPVD